MPPPAEALTEGSTVRALVRLAVPFIAGTMLNLLVLIVDRLWIGDVGTTALAALGTASVALMVISTLMLGMGIGTLAGVARHVGQDQPLEAGRYYGRGMFIALVVGLVLVALAFPLPPLILSFMGTEAGVAGPAEDYLRIMMAASLIQAPMFVQNFALQGAGEARAALIVSTVAPAVNAVLDPIFIFVLDWGLAGAAWASAAAYGAGLLTGAVLLARGNLRLKVVRASFAGGLGIGRRVVQVGVPGTLEHLVRTMASFFLVTILTPFGEAVLSAYTIALVIAMALVFPGLAIGQAAASLMGQNLGAGKPRRAWTTAWQAVGLYLGLMLVAAAVVYVFAEGLIGVFDSNPEVVAQGALLLRIQVVAYPTIAVALVLSKAFGGAGQTRPAMLSAMGGHLLFQIPAAWLLSQEFGPAGAYWAMAGAYMIHALLQSAQFVHRYRPGGVLERALAAGEPVPELRARRSR